MNFSIRAIIRALVAPKHRLSCPPKLWQKSMAELRRRGEGTRESGAFLLGTMDGMRRRISQFVYYDDLDPRSLDTGIVVFNGDAYGPLWQLCRDKALSVIGDVHTHPDQARQSQADRLHPMVATAGHIALIVPRFAQGAIRISEMGIYEYLGEHRWRDHSGKQASQFFYMGIWG